eukprot:935694_1
MADGGMKRISQSYAIPPIIAKNEDRMAGSREISTVDVILEEHENEYIDMNEDSPQQKDKNKNESVHQGVLLKQPSAPQTPTIPIASPPEDMMVQTSSFPLIVESPQSGKYPEHNRQNSMEVEYDERSAFKEEVIYNNTNYRHPPMHMHMRYSNNWPYGFAKKRSKHNPVDANENYHLQNELDEHEENEKIKSPKSKSMHDKTKTKRQYTQYAVRSSNSEKQPMNVTAIDSDEDSDFDFFFDIEHAQMIVLHEPLHWNMEQHSNKSNCICL